MKRLYILAVAILVTLPVMSKKMKKAESAWFFLDPITENTISANDSIVINYSINKALLEKFNCSWTIEIENNSNRDIYIDLQKSFVITCGKTEPMYVPKSTSNTESNTSAYGINFGIVGFGEANTSASTTVVFAQRVIIIPSGTSKTLSYPVFYAPNTYELRNRQELITTLYNDKYKYHMAFFNESGDDLYKGNVIQYDKKNTVAQLGVMIRYSYHDDLSKMLTNKQMYYVRYLIGTRIGDDAPIVREFIPEVFDDYYNTNMFFFLH